MTQQDDDTSDHSSSAGNSYGGETMLERRSSMTSSITTTTTTVGKTGRKGDPRMHRAVEARLINPKLSLLNALKIGGFEYQNDDDANIIDSEHVTLGQRKNQLSRRIRLAVKQQQQQHTTNPQGSPSQQLQRAASDAQSSTTESEQCDSTGSLVTLPIHQVFGSNKRPFNSSPKSDSVIERLSNDDMDLSNTFRRRYDPLKPADTDFLEPQIPTPVDSESMCARSSLRNLSLFIPQEKVPSGTELPDSRSSFLADGDINADNGKKNLAASKKHRNGPTLRRPTSASSSSSSTVAVASLSQTAASIGMTLDQLALALRSSNNLATTLIPSQLPSKSQHALAVALYQTENRSLYARSMLLAGFSHEVAQNEQSPHHLQVALDAWQLEGRRLKSLVGQSRQHRHLQGLSQEAQHRSRENSIDISSVSTIGIEALLMEGTDNDDGNTHDTPKVHNGSSLGASIVNSDHHDQPRDRMAMVAAHSYHYHEPSQRSEDNGHHHHNQTSSSNSDVECINETSRHIHRLGGKCGHVPILHQPVGGLPHIDFVVGDRVECYHGMQALSPDLLWPSSFSCEDLSCPEACREDTVPPKAKDHEHKHSECIIGGDPKVFDLNELNLDGVEWNLDFSTGESVMGLFKLAEQ